MSHLDYADIFERYMFGGARALRDLTPGLVTVSQLPPQVERQRDDWLDGEPTLALQVKASWRRCAASVSSALRRHEDLIRELPCTAKGFLEADASSRLLDVCRRVYGDSRLRVVVGLNFYCTRRSLRIHPMPGVTRVTRGNVDEIITALKPGIGEYADESILANGPAFAFYHNGRPVGFAGVHSSFMSDKVGNVGCVFVEEAHRGRGIAKAVVSAVAGELLAAGRVPVYGCFADNTGSVRTAQRAGFAIRGYNCRIFVARYTC